MPNHIRTKIKPDKKYEEIASAILSETTPKEGEEAKPFLDFNKIIPQPEGIEQGGCRGEHEPGVICWYEWNIEHWGTKWDAYDFDEYAKYDKEFSFQTAWTTPIPIIEALSRMFPDVEFNVRYADEDIGSNLGQFLMKDGKKTWERVFSGALSVEDEKELFALRLRRD